MKFAGILFALIVCWSCKRQAGVPGQLNIEWTDELPGDFSFINEWNYPAGIYKNEYGQLSCDGFCPPETDAMKDSTGRIYTDSLRAFYELVDTTHQHHSILCEAWCYEWAGTDLAIAERNKDTVSCYTLGNMATHSSLQLLIANNTCLASIHLKSITSGKENGYFCNKGFVKIDQALWKTGILKAEFDLGFHNQDDTTKPMFWKGKIYTPILDSRALDK